MQLAEPRPAHIEIGLLQLGDAVRRYFSAAAALLDGFVVENPEISVDIVVDGTPREMTLRYAGYEINNDAMVVVLTGSDDTTVWQCVAYGTPDGAFQPEQAVYESPQPGHSIEVILGT